MEAGFLMDALVMELSDQAAAMKKSVEVLVAEIKRIRAASQHVIDKSSFSSQEDLADLGKAIRHLQIELDKFAPSKDRVVVGVIATKAKKSTRH